jgi:hypothetical protein
MPANRPLPAPRVATIEQPGDHGDYNVRQVSHGIKNPARAPQMRGAIGLSAQTMGTQGKLSWQTAHVGEGRPLSISSQFRGTVVNF